MLNIFLEFSDMKMLTVELRRGMHRHIAEQRIFRLLTEQLRRGHQRAKKILKTAQTKRTVRKDPTGGRLPTSIDDTGD